MFSLTAAGWRWCAQIPAHRVLFCSTLVGKTSIVRQLEPDLHVDGHPHTVRLRQMLVAAVLPCQTCRYTGTYPPLLG